MRCTPSHAREFQPLSLTDPGVRSPTFIVFFCGVSVFCGQASRRVDRRNTNVRFMEGMLAVGSWQLAVATANGPLPTANCQLPTYPRLPPAPRPLKCGT